MAAAAFNPDLPTTLAHPHIEHLKRVHRGKVRDVYAIDDDRLLMVASDRLSAFDVVLPDPIPGKGEILTQLSNFWFEHLCDLCPNHLLSTDPSAVLEPLRDAARYRYRAVIVKRLRPLPIEAIVRGYLAGSGFAAYQRDGNVCGLVLPAGLRLAEQLPEPIYTPSSKAAVGAHDEHISFDRTVELLGAEVAEQVRGLSMALYQHASDFAAARGVIIADTKFEFGVDAQGVVHLMDEVLTPDSSRFWPADTVVLGASPPSFDKQFVRDYLETMDWDKTAPGPGIPTFIVKSTQQRYREALKRLAG